MRRILLVAILIVILLGAVVLIRFLTFSPIRYEPLGKKVAVISHPEVLAGAIEFETISHKPGMIDQHAFEGFQRHLEVSFPLSDSLLGRTVVEDYSLIYYWEGTDVALEPVIFMAHMDVVPVEYSTLKEWYHPAFGGIMTDEFIYGRGALDDKGSLIAIMDAVENLLASGFQPKRSIYLCFGHDEEIGGAHGAQRIRDYFKGQKIKAWFVLDEGGTLASELLPGITDTVALIGTSEKGYISLEISAGMPGGHSSMPEKTNALASVNRALNKLDNNPLPYRLSSPLEGFVEHVGPHMKGLKKMAFANTWLFKTLIFDAYSESPAGEALIHTTQVATIFNAGVKDNVVPYRAQAVVNYRLLPGDSPEFIIERAREIIDDSLVSVRVYQELAIPASPVSEIDCDQFRNIAGAVISTNPGAVISPYLVLGATDSRHFYEISDHVYRFSPIPIGKDDLARIHGLNERVALISYQKAVGFYATLINSL